MNADCKHCQPLLSAFVDNETNEQENQFIRQHLQTCLECQETLESYRAIRLQFSRVNQPLPPVTLRRAVLTQVRNGPKTVNFKPRNVFPVGRILAGAMVVVVVFVLGIVVALTFLNRQPAYDVAGITASPMEITITFTQDIDENLVKAKAQQLFSATNSDNQVIQFEIKKVEKNTVILEPKAPLPPGESVKVTVQNIPSKEGVKLPEQHVESKVVLPAPTATPTKAPTSRATTVEAQNVTSRPPTTTTTSATTTNVASTTAAVVTKSANPPTAALATPAPSTAAVITTAVISTTVAATTVVPSPTVTTDISPTPAIPTPTVAGCAIVPIRGFGKLLAENPDIAAKVGCPTNNEANALLAYESFEKGFMLFNAGQVYVLYGNNWRVYQDTFVTPTPAPSAAANATPLPPTPTQNNFGCTVEPINGFGKLWRDNAEVRGLLGCATQKESSTAGGAIQQYSSALFYFNPIDILGPRIYVLYKAGTLGNYPDTFK